MWIGYARTSTADQIADLELQKKALEAAGCEKTFSEQVSSAAARVQLGAALEFVGRRDVFVVTTPDRLARSTAELLSILDGLIIRQVHLVILSFGGKRFDTRSPTSKLIVTILAGVATWKRDIVLEGQREGAAKGITGRTYRGRQPTVVRQADDIWRLRNEGLSASDIAEHLGIARVSVYRVLAQMRSKIADVDGIR